MSYPSNGAHGIDLVNTGFVNCRVVLSGKKDSLVASQRGFKRSNACGPPDHKGNHCIREYHDVPDRDHRALDHVGGCAVAKFVHCFLRFLVSSL